MKNYPRFNSTIIVIAIFLAVAIFSNTVQAQGKIIATLNFDPETDGFGFQNYPHDEMKPYNWQNDLTYYDMMLMFGVKSVCVTGNSNANCVAKRPAENWRIKELQGMDSGHCEGMAAASLLFFEEYEFKKKKTPAQFQKNAEVVNKLTFPSPSIENYIAYFFVTQLFDGVYEFRDVYAKKGPVNTVKDLVAAMNDQNATTYTLSVNRTKNGKWEGHTVTPIAVEDTGNAYRIHIYDNNHPDKTQEMTVQKGGKQKWTYNLSTNLNNPTETWTGDISTRSFFITPNNARYGKKFPVPFGFDDEEYRSSSSNSSKGEQVEFLVNDDADLLVTDGDGKKIGYDWKKQKTVNEISGAKIINVATGTDENLPPVLHLPFQPDGKKPYTITLSGKSLKKESRPDLVYSGPGFSVGFDGIKLDPNETLNFQISPDGKEISFTASADGETPEIYFSRDGKDDKSYLVEVDGVELEAGKTISGEFDEETGKFHFKDNDGNEDKYDVDFERVLPDGKVQTFETDDLEIGESENFEMDFSEWDGESPMCFRDDDDGDGFADDECEAQPNEDNDLDADDADDEGDDEDSDIDNDGKFNNVDDDDDGDGILDDVDKDEEDDDDGDGDDSPNK